MENNHNDFENERSQSIETFGTVQSEDNSAASAEPENTPAASADNSGYADIFAKKEEVRSESGSSNDASSFSDGSFTTYEPQRRDENYRGYYPGASYNPNPNIPQNPYTPPYSAQPGAQYGGAQYGTAPGGYDPYRQPQRNGYYPEIRPDESNKKSTGTKLLKIFAWIFFGLSFFSIFATFVLAIASTDSTYDGTVPVIVFTLFPIVALTLGIILSVKRSGGTKFIIVGAIATFFCLLFLLITVSESNTTTLDEDEAQEFLEQTERVLDINLPIYEDCTTSEYDDVTITSYTVTDTDARFAMYRIIKNDPKCISGDIPNAYIGLLPESQRGEMWDLQGIVIYNNDLETYNSNPTKNGVYDMTVVCFYDDGYDAYYTIMKYSVNFVALPQPQI